MKELKLTVASKVSQKTAPKAFSAEARYVWRMARFYGGLDKSMPFGAVFAMGTGGNAKELDELAKEIAAEFGG